MDASTVEDELVLPEGYSFVDDEEDFTLPEGYSFVEEEQVSKPVQEPQQEQKGFIEGLSDYFRPFFEQAGERAIRESEIARQRPQDYATVGKGVASSATIGLSEKIPGLERPEDEKDALLFDVGEFEGALIPIAGIQSVVGKGAAKLAAKSPVLKKTIQSVGTLFGTGATYKSAEDLIKKGEIDPIGSVVNGASWVALDGALKGAGLSLKFADKLAQKSDLYKVPRDFLLNKVIQGLERSGVAFASEEELAQKALQLLEEELDNKTIRKGQEVFEKRLGAESEAQFKASKEAAERMKSLKVSDESIVALDQNAEILSKNITPKNLDVSSEVEKLAESAVRSKIDQVGTRAMTKAETGDFVKAALELEMEDALLRVKPLYNEAKDRTRYINHRANKTGANMARELQELVKVKTRPENYNKAISAYETALQDLGAVIERDAQGNIQQVVFEEVPVDQLIELTQRLYKVIKFDKIDKNVVNTLEKHVLSLKDEIKTAIKSDSEAYAAYTMAEDEFKNVIAPKFKNKTVRDIRAAEDGEKIAKVLDSPHAMNQLKKSLPEDAYIELERQVLEKVEEKGYDQSKQYFNRMKEDLSKENQKLAEEIVRAKNPNNPLVRQKLSYQEILEDVGKATNNGTRPEKTLALWQTPRGAKVVKKAFKDSPNWPKVKKYLENQTFADMVKTITKDGKFNGVAVRDLMKNRQFRDSIKSLGGEDALLFFETLDKRVDKFQKVAQDFQEYTTSRDFWKRLERGLKNAEKDTEGQLLLKTIADKEASMSKKFKAFEDYMVEKLGFSGRQVMSILGVTKLAGVAGVKGLGVPLASMLGYKFMKKLATNRNFRRKFTQLTKNGIEKDPVLYIKLISELSDEALEE